MILKFNHDGAHSFSSNMDLISKISSHARSSVSIGRTSHVFLIPKFLIRCLIRTGSWYDREEASFFVISSTVLFVSKYMHRTNQKFNMYSTPEISILLFLSTENWTSESINLQANKSLDCSSLLSPLLLTQSQNKKSPVSSCSYRISNPHCIGPPRARTKNHLFNLEKKKRNVPEIWRCLDCGFH